MVSRIPEATAAGIEAMQAAIHTGIEAGVETAQSKLDSQAGSRGYALQGKIVDEYWRGGGKFFIVGHSEQWGDDPWFFRFFEYGTVHIEAMPFIRPGYRAARKRFLEAMGPEFAGFVRANAYVPPGATGAGLISKFGGKLSGAAKAAL